MAALTWGSIHVKQTSNDITSGPCSGDGVLCHALFGFPTEAILIKTETEKNMSGGQLCIQEMSLIGKLSN